MIWKTEIVRKRIDKDWMIGSTEEHVELVKRETWWFLIFPIYSRETIVHTSM